MKFIEEYAERIKMALYDAKEYAEKYLYYKSINNLKYSQAYYEMARDEVNHAKCQLEFATEEVERLIKVYKPTETMKRAWDELNEHYIRESEAIRKMIEA